ncbi:LemA family protein [Petrimonas mucosa]|uniref:LemA family protein n=1 Tax=Petrimonas mucosa TaxID=1642646 RepID=UPI00175E6E2E|nr:LemA family protein [Petrimonas mucosa]HHT28982.1 LemA family protein [Petrimonas mucosa]
MGKKTIFWFFVFIVLLFLVPLFWGTYNRLVKRDEAVKMAWAQVENQYQRRADLIMNLVETVKGYAAHEQETFTRVIEARAKATQVTVDADHLNAETLTQFNKAQGELSQALSRLMVVVERYPDLKANENFIMLQGQLEGTENRIATERKRFNETVNKYNTYLRRFPRNMVARVLGFGKKEYFGADTGADTTPDVKF